MTMMTMNDNWGLKDTQGMSFFHPFFVLLNNVGRQYVERLRDVEESVLMRDKMHETLP